MTIGTISIIIGVVLLILLKLFFGNDKSSEPDKGLTEIDHDELFKEDLEFDPSWSVLSSNTHHPDDE